MGIVAGSWAIVVACVGLLFIVSWQVCGLLILSGSVGHVGAMSIKGGNFVIAIAFMVIAVIVVIVIAVVCVVIIFVIIIVVGVLLIGRLKQAAQLQVISWAMASKSI